MHAQCSHLTSEDVAVLQFSFSWPLAQPSDQLSLNYGLCRSTLSYTQEHTSSDSYVCTYVCTYTTQKYVRMYIHDTEVRTYVQYIRTCMTLKYVHMYIHIRTLYICTHTTQKYIPH